MLFSTAQLLAGLIILVVGADGLVRGAVRLSTLLRVSPLIIGLTVCSFGTSAPELSVGIISSLHHQPNIAMGNVLGSNIFNIFVVIGVSALITPLRVNINLIRMDVPVMIVLSLLIYFFALDHHISTVDGSVLLFLFVVYILILLRIASGQKSKEFESEIKEIMGDHKPKKNLREYLTCSVFISTGLVALGLGSQWFVEGSTVVARYFGISELVIGLSIIAVGTSLPEIATSVVAALKRQNDIAVGNVVGSNIFNILIVLGFSSLLSKHGLSVDTDVLHLHLPVLIGASIACFPIFFSGFQVERWEGIFFLLYYIAYSICLFLRATRQISDTDGYALWIKYGAALIVFLSLSIWFRRRKTSRSSSH